MKLRLLSSIVLGLSLTAAVCAQDANQDANPAPSAGQNSGAGNGAGNGGNGGGYGRRDGRGGGRGGMMGNGVEGTVTAIAADHYTIKTYTGDVYTVNYSANTRFLKQPPGGQGNGQGGAQGAGQASGGGQGQGGGMGRRGQGRGQGGGMNRMEQIKSTDIKVGDAVTAAGQVDATAKTVGAIAVVEMDPARAKEMAQLEANYGKTWLMGKVTAINDTKVTIMGSVDNAAHTFMADENTVFRKQRDPVTLADIQIGDMVRVEGASNDAGFTATMVNVMPANGNGQGMRRNASPPQ